jgi:hypothetical protein
VLLSGMNIDDRITVDERSNHVTFNGLNGKFAVWEHMADEGRIYTGTGLTDNGYVYHGQYRCFLGSLNRHLL